MPRLRTASLSALLGLAAVASIPGPTLGAEPCRVRNSDQGTSGGSLKAMAAAANDGEQLRVRGVCRGEVVVGADITISGVGDVAAITGEGVRRALRIQPGAAVTIRHLVVRDGRAGSQFQGGGGIRNRGELLILESVIRDNLARPGGLGGGILNLGDLTIFDSTVRRNRASRGGGIDSRRLDAADPLPSLSVGGTRIVRNRAENGGGIHNMGEALVEFSDIERNRAGFGGGGIANVQTGDLDVENTNIRDNGADEEGGGIANYDGGTVTLSAVTFSGNSPQDCVGVAC